jgi:flagellar protein FliO/FliZ
MKTAPGDVEVPWQRLVYGVGIVLVLVCGGIYLLKLIGGARFGKGRYLDVVEVVPMGHKFRLVLVRIGERAVLLACKGDNVEKVGEFAADNIPVEETPDGGKAAGFANVLGDVLRGHND